jgi:hypothetical protein
MVGRLKSDFLQGQVVPRPHRLQWAPETSFQEVKRPESEANHTPSSNAEPRIKFHIHFPNVLMAWWLID